jgi:chromosome segregation ATPase
MSETLMITLIGVASGLITSVLTYLFTRRKDKADITDKLTDTAGKLIDKLNVRLDDLEIENKDLRQLAKRMDELEDENRDLRKKIDQQDLELSRIRKMVGDLTETVNLYRDRLNFMVMIARDIICQCKDAGIIPKRKLPAWAEEFAQYGCDDSE